MVLSAGVCWVLPESRHKVCLTRPAPRTLDTAGAGKAEVGPGSGGRAAGLTPACGKAEQSGSGGQGRQGRAGFCGDAAGKHSQARRPSPLPSSLPWASHPLACRAFIPGPCLRACVTALPRTAPQPCVKGGSMWNFFPRSDQYPAWQASAVTVTVGAGAWASRVLITLTPSCQMNLRAIGSFFSGSTEVLMGLKGNIYIYFLKIQESIHRGYCTANSENAGLHEATPSCPQLLFDKHQHWLSLQRERRWWLSGPATPGNLPALLLPTGGPAGTSGWHRPTQTPASVSAKEYSWCSAVYGKFPTQPGACAPR